MLGGGLKMRNDNGRLAHLFVGPEEVEEEAEVRAEEALVVQAMLLVAQVACQGAIEAHRKRGEVALA